MSIVSDAAIQLEALQSLLQHPGWHIIEARIRGDLAQALARMKESKSSDELLRHTYTYIALGEILKTPELLMKPLVMTLTVSKK